MSEINQAANKCFFSDNNGNPSAMRLMSMLALIVASFLAIVQVFNIGNTESNDTELVLYFLIAAFAPKAVQKFAER